MGEIKFIIMLLLAVHGDLPFSTFWLIVLLPVWLPIALSLALLPLGLLMIAVVAVIDAIHSRFF